VERAAILAFGFVDGLNVNHIVARIERAGDRDLLALELAGRFLIVQVIPGFVGVVAKNEERAVQRHDDSREVFGLLIGCLLLVRCGSSRAFATPLAWMVAGLSAKLIAARLSTAMADLLVLIVHL